MNSQRIFIFFLVILWKFETGNFVDIYQEEIESLSELPLDKLIKIKSSIAPILETSMIEKYEEPEGRIKSTLPIALPLKRNNKLPIRRHGSDYYEEKGKDTKISKIFQLAVTALSFLAFGGYLLTLIITAIRRNTNSTGNGNVIVFSNLQNLQKYQRPKRNLLVLDPMENNFQTDKLYQGMIMLSRTYARFEH
ncbi:uncharacterized protein LOC124955878 [Vespa velutina]|uniref:uncharacterized protein LOC124955878 n=1 Tax=Vespa velutina TaxID=202808 RepID=UPI001FB4DD10|nr:uncharacterized protein LOC124955878 [Vespa velutina]XP_047366917.1 uncharacterized protein LOC124955878 [Vespa velutina]